MPQTSHQQDAAVFAPEEVPWSAADFLKYFETFLAAHPELPATRFGALAAADRAFMTRMRSGERANQSIQKLERVVKFIQSYKSGDVWDPAGLIERLSE